MNGAHVRTCRSSANRLEGEALRAAVAAASAAAGVMYESLEGRLLRQQWRLLLPRHSTSFHVIPWKFH